MMLTKQHIAFIEKNLDSNLAELVLKGIPFDDIDPSFIAQQIQARQQIGKKLPSWIAKKQIVFPPRINLAQSSSEFTAHYKSTIIKARNVVDLTGGFGIDTFALAKTNTKVIYVEKSIYLVEIVKYNAKVFGIDNIDFKHTTAEEYLKIIVDPVDWLYIDPSRRDEAENKVFLFEDCVPNILDILPLIKQKSSFLLMKTSPLIDIKYGIRTLQYVKAVHIVAVENDLKELLWELDFSKHIEFPKIKTIQFKKEKAFYFEIDTNSNVYEIEYSLPLKYIYEPNVALMKAGMFNQLAQNFQLKKLHPNTHLFTSEKQVLNFPGRSFNVETTEAYKPKVLKKKWKAKKMNISTRNFPIVAKDLIKLLNTKDGGENYVFFTTDLNHQKIVISCIKLL